MRVLASLAIGAILAHLSLAAPATQCSSRQYLDSASGTCKICPTGMNTCSSATVAITCTRGRYITPTKQCVLPNACPTGTYPDSASTSCKKCYQVNAATCKDGSQKGSTSCMSGSCLYNGKCAYNNRMAGGFYCSAAGIQTACSDGASKCDSTGKATTCKTGYSLTTAGACIQCTTAQPFDTVSQTCKNVAGTCASDHVYNVAHNFCEPICKTGSIVNGRYSAAGFYVYDEGMCMPCGVLGAYQCNGQGQVVSCLEDAGYIQGRGYCAKCTSDQIFNADANKCQCQGAAYTTDSSGKITITRPAKVQDLTTEAESCVPCPESLTALTCTAAGSPTGIPVITSATCLPGYQLIDGSCNHCATDGYAFVPATGECKSITCPDATYKNGEGGISNVQPAQRVDLSTGTCIVCEAAHALHCDSTGAAVTCLPGTKLGADGTCLECKAADQLAWDPTTRACKVQCRGNAIVTPVDKDPSQYAIWQPANRYDPDTNTCVDCNEPNAGSCDPQTGETTTCIWGYVSFAGSCYLCPSSTGNFNPSTAFCEKRCQSGEINQYGNYTPALRYDYASDSCVQCMHTGAQQCDSSGAATTCLSGWTQVNGDCIKN